VVNKSRVSADLWCIEYDQKSCAWWLLLISDIGVPCDTAVSVGKEAFEFTFTAIAVDKVDLRVSFWSSAGLRKKVRRAFNMRLQRDRWLPDEYDASQSMNQNRELLEWEDLPNPDL
jgi:hypothetical protein